MYIDIDRERRKWHSTPVLLPGKSHGWRSLVGCSPWGWEESDTNERLHFHFSFSCLGEGNGNPLQCSCLENPRDGEPWWSAVCGVAQSWTQLMWLSSIYMYTHTHTHTHTHTYILFHILFHLSHDTEYSSLCYTVRCCLSILCTSLYLMTSNSQFIHLSSPSLLAITSLFSTSMFLFHG